MCFVSECYIALRVQCSCAYVPLIESAAQHVVCPCAVQAVQQIADLQPQDTKPSKEVRHGGMAAAQLLTALTPTLPQAPGTGNVDQRSNTIAAQGSAVSMQVAVQPLNDSNKARLGNTPAAQSSAVSTQVSHVNLTERRSAAQSQIGKVVVPMSARPLQFFFRCLNNNKQT